MKPNPGSKGGGRFWLLLLLLLASLPLGYWLVLGGQSELPAPVVEAPPEPVEAPLPRGLAIVRTEGKVEVMRDGEAWMPARSGDQLAEQDLVRTGTGGSALLEADEGLRVTLEQETEIEVEALTETLSSLLLGEGMATAEVAPGERGRMFQVNTRGGDAVARTRDGTFTISSDGEGTVAVGTREGAVELSGAGRAVIVRNGERSMVQAGRAPTAPTALPESLLLEVRWPEEAVVASRTLEVEGRAEPGARVWIGRRKTMADGEGRFRTTVRLREGENRLDVKAVGVGGTTAQAARRIEVDTRVEGTSLDEDLWKQ